MSPEPIYTIDEFERESRHLERNIWESLAIEPGMRVLICGYGPDGAQVQRAIDDGAEVTVIEHRDDAISRFAGLGARLMRGSTSVIPAKDRTFDLAISFHYLHEVDPFFHAQIVAELARVALRIALVEPAPPADALGKRIALLYSQAKRELGAFEYYQPMEYWKKLLQAVKADIAQHVFAFGKVPPREYLADTVELLLRTMEVEEAPRSYIDELRNIARRPESMLLPPPRYVLVGAPVGELPALHFSAREPDPPEAAAVTEPTQPATKPAVPAKPVSVEAGYEFPPVDAPSSATSPAPPAAPPATPPPATPPRAAPTPNPAPQPSGTPGFGFGFDLPYGAPEPPTPGSPPPPVPPPFGAPFAMPPIETPEAPPPTTAWQWEPPEGDDEPFGQPPIT